MDQKVTSPGSLLVSVRESQGILPQQVADMLHLPLRFIQAMETDNYEKGPQPTFARGYLRAYARLLQISPDEVLEAFDALKITAPQPIVTSAALSKTFYEISHVHSRLRFAFLMLLLLVALVLFFYDQYAKFFSFHIKTWVEPTLSEMKATESLLPETTVAVPPFLANSDSALWPSFVEETLETFQAMDAATQETLANIQATANLATLEMAFDDECWVSVKDSTQKRLMSGLMERGKQLKLSGVAPFYVVLGRVSGVHLWLNGQTVDTSHYAEDRVAKITVDTSQVELSAL